MKRQAGRDNNRKCEGRSKEAEQQEAEGVIERRNKKERESRSEEHTSELQSR